MDILLANPRGFCAGVDRAIEIVNRALETLGAPIYVRHEVVHNRFVVDDLRQRGAVFVEELYEVPDGATVIFSAHGVSQAVREEADAAGLKVFDATCPLVTKVHLEVARQCRAGRDMVLIGHAGHPEVEGTMGQWSAQAGGGAIYLVEDMDDVATLQLGQPDNLRLHHPDHAVGGRHPRHHRRAAGERFPAIQGPRNDDICYATQNRQDAVRDLVGAVRSGAGGGFAQQLQLQPPARAGRARGRGGAPDRRRGRDRPRVGRGPPPHRHHRRRFGARSAGAGRDRPPARLWAPTNVANWPASPRTWCSPCPRNCGCSWSTERYVPAPRLTLPRGAPYNPPPCGAMPSALGPPAAPPPE